MYLGHFHFSFNCCFLPQTEEKAHSEVRISCFLVIFVILVTCKSNKRSNSDTPLQSPTSVGSLNQTTKPIHLPIYLPTLKPSVFKNQNLTLCCIILWDTLISKYIIHFYSLAHTQSWTNIFNIHFHNFPGSLWFGLLFVWSLIFLWFHFLLCLCAINILSPVVIFVQDCKLLYVLCHVMLNV